MAVIALLKRSILFSCFFCFLMTILAVFVKGILEFIYISLFFQWVVAFTTLLDGIALFPDILAILVIMVAICTGNLVILGMFLMMKFYRPFDVFLIALIGYADFIRHIGRCKGPHRQKKHA